MDIPKIQIEIVWGDVSEQHLISLEVRRGTSLGEAISAAQSLKKIPEFDLNIQQVGIFGVIKSLDTMLQSNDRIEIYKPLLIDPKEARRKRFQKSQSHKG